jgi:hypothetical protein
VVVGSAIRVPANDAVDGPGTPTLNQAVSEGTLLWLKKPHAVTAHLLL